MAFVSRSKRDGVKADPSTQAHVGPGAYSNLYEYAKEISYAPFSSTAERSFHDSRSNLPGPGSYALVSSQQLSGSGKSTSNPFKTRIPRLASDRQKESYMKNPGPGSYSLAKGWIKSTHRYTGSSITKSAEVVFRKKQTAPSVPARNQSYGYEESEGSLVMLAPPKDGHSGIKGDTVGPGGYSPSVVPHDRVPGFGKSKTQRKLFNVMENPGPGQYIEEKGMNLEDMPPVGGSSNFASRVPKLDSGKKLKVPGPGTYSHSESFREQATERAQQTKSFLSTAPCSYEIDTTKSLSAPTNILTPGPGTYGQNSSSFKKELVNSEEMIAPFTSTAKRFNVPKSMLGLPGPGAYDEDNEDSFVTALGKRVISRAGVFGTTTSRFRQQTEVEKGDQALNINKPSQKQKHASQNKNQNQNQLQQQGLSKDKTPGPGAYFNEMSNTVSSFNDKQGKPLSAFVSTTPRFLQNQEVDGTESSENAGSSPVPGASTSRVQVPPPGAYELQNLWSGTQKRGDRQYTFLSSSTRFNDSIENIGETPGPGAYSAYSGPKKKGDRSRHVFKSNSNRFKLHDSYTPGPGSYNLVDVPSRSMVKRSFNVTLDI